MHIVCNATIFLIILLYVIHGLCSPPNIVLIVADDLGWTDVSFHGSDQIPTPHIDKLAKEGIILNNYYVQPICSPSRSALMTGKYPIHTGMYHGVIRPSEPYGVSLQEKLLPEYLQELGYSTHIVGKWHLGFFEKEYTPTYRGFDSFYGYYTGAEDYFHHNKSSYHFKFSGLDLHHDENGEIQPVSTQDGNYSSYMYAAEAIDRIEKHQVENPLFLYLPFQNVHGPLLAPKEWIDKFSYIEDKNRRTFAAMVGCLDDAIGKIYEALSIKGILDDTIIAFTSDNGAIAGEGFSSNYPLRGEKHMVFEGGVRVPAFIHGKLLKNPGRTSMELMHITDWLPTLVNLAQGEVSGSIDGFDQWKTLQELEHSPREEILLNIDDIDKTQEALISGEWKIIRDSISIDLWMKPPGFNASGKSYSVVDCGEKPSTINHCNKKHCLFNLITDPCEYDDVSEKYPVLLETMKAKLEQYREGMVPSRKLPGDKSANPKYHCGVWMPWKGSNSL